MTNCNRKYVITILTATYNRKESLKQLFSSLISQTATGFQWLVIDDGSTDNTADFISSLQTNKFDIDYIRKENGGKHTALNFSHEYIKGELVFMVDSDDYLTEDSIEIILSDWEKYKNNPQLCGISYLKQYPNGQHLSQLSPNDYYEANDILYRVNNEIKGDRAEVLRTDCFNSFLFPEFKNEKFCSEGMLFNTLAYNYNFIYRNRAIYNCEYREDGLTKAGRKLRMRNPLGMMENCKSFFVPNVKSKIQIKEMLLYWAYGLQAQYSFSKIIKTSGMGWKMFFLFPIGLVLYWRWKI